MFIVFASVMTVAALTNESSDPSLTRPSVLWLGMDLETSLFKQGWCGGGDILVVDLCPRAPPLRRRLLQRRRGAWEVVQERMQIVVCIDDIWKTEHVLGSWMAGMVFFCDVLVAVGARSGVRSRVRGVAPV